MAKYYHRGSHCDGVWYRLFPTEEAARADMAKAGPLERSWSGQVDSNGGTHSVGVVPYGVKSAAGMKALERAYDAREMGTLTAAQKALLTRLGE